MRNTVSAFLFIIIILNISCGVSAEEKARIEERARKQLQTELAEKEALKASLKEKETNLDYTKSELVHNKATLEVEKERMNEVKSFHLMRTDMEKEQQIRDQSMRIQKVEESIKILESNIPVIEGQIAELRTKLEK